MIILSIWLAIFHENIYKLPNYFSIKCTEKLFTFKGNLELKRNGFWHQKWQMLCPYVCFFENNTPPRLFFKILKENTKKFLINCLEKMWDLSFNKIRFSEKDRNEVFHSGLKAHELTAALCRNKRLQKTFLCALLDDTSKNKWGNSHR